MSFLIDIFASLYYNDLFLRESPVIVSSFKLLNNNQQSIYFEQLSNDRKYNNRMVLFLPKYNIRKIR